MNMSVLSMNKVSYQYKEARQKLIKNLKQENFTQLLENQVLGNQHYYPY